MGLIESSARLRAGLLGAALVVALALPAAVSADTTGGGAIQPASSRGATITLDAVHRLSKVLARVDISFTCDPLRVYDWETGTTSTTTAGHLDAASAVIVQASGRTVAAASGDAFGGDVTCDGTTLHRVSIDVVASTMPFKAGAAAAGATVSIADASFEANDYASTGAVMVKLAR